MNTKIKKILSFFLFDLVFLLGGSATYFATPWGLKNYPMQMHWNVFFVLSANTSGHDSGTGRSIIFGFVIPAIILFLVFQLIFYVLKKKTTFINDTKLNIFKTVFFAGSVIVLVCGTTMWNYLNIAKIMKSAPIDSEFYKENCVVDFRVKEPAKKRNIIYIFMESMESDFADLENGGVFENNLIPHLTEIAKQNISFSETMNIRGGTNLQGTSWTVAGLLSKLYALPYFQPFTKDESGLKCLKNATSLNDVLKDQGYTQIFSMGSEKQFEDRDTVLETHNVEIHDINWYKEQNLLPKDYQVFWGFEDLKLYEMAKLELQNLSSKNEPFFYGMLTVDTHFPGGYLCQNCKNEENKQIENVIRCADEQIYSFINWIKDQEWYKNTTIIITGDHNYLDAPLNCFINEESKLTKKEINKKRKFLNIFINPAVKITSQQEKNRKFSSFDITPTLLEATGNKIEGAGMYFGRSLLSDQKTLCERYGQNEIEKELLKKTVQYESLK